MLSNIINELDKKCLNPNLFLFYLFVMAVVFCMIIYSKPSNKGTIDIIGNIGMRPTTSF